MTKDRFTPFAFALLASLSLAACSSSGSDQAMTPAPVTPAPETPAPETPEPGTPEPGTPEPGTPEPGEVTTETSLATEVITALTIEEGDAASGIAVATNITGAEGAPVLSDTTYTVDGVEYTLIEQNDPDAQRGDLFAVEVASVEGVKAIGTGEFGILNEQGSDADRIDILFSAAPTEVADLPSSTANYAGTFDAAFFDVQDQESGTVSGIFTATADFGTAQSLTGSINAENADGSAGEQYAILTADIEGNSFSGVINNDVDDPNNTDEQISAAGYFTGDNASGLVGAAAGTFVHSEDESEEALIVFQATAE